MNDDWRLQVDLHDPAHSEALVERLEARGLEHDLSDAFHDRVIVSRNGARIFLYAGSREQIEAARRLLERLDDQHGWDLEIDLRRWHHEAEDWEGPDKPLPTNEAARKAEHEALVAAERKRAEKRGHPEFEVRADLPSRHEAIRFAQQLRSEGLAVVHRWKFLLVGAADEDEAKSLARRIESEAPPGSRVVVEGTWREAYGERPGSPFAIFGGLGN